LKRNERARDHRLATYYVISGWLGVGSAAGRRFDTCADLRVSGTANHSNRHAMDAIAARVKKAAL
jgi:hypothetical protein